MMPPAREQRSSGAGEFAQDLLSRVLPAVTRSLRHRLEDSAGFRASEAIAITQLLMGWSEFDAGSVEAFWEPHQHRIVTMLRDEPLDIGLFGGLAGLAHVCRHAHLRHGRLSDVHFALDKLVPSITEVGAGSRASNCDLISGSAGIGVALSGAPGWRADPIVARLLSLQQEPAPPLWTIDETARKGIAGVDMGIAHGVPGVMLAMAHLADSASDALMPAIGRFIDRGLDWVAFSQNPPDSGSAFPYFSGQAATTRLAWCYGDLSVGYALWWLGRWRGRQSLEALGLQVVLHAAKRTGADTQISDPFLCHGTGGVLLIVSRVLDRADEGTSIVNAWRRWHAAAVEAALGDTEFVSLEYFEGFAGIVLQALEDVDAIDGSWRRPLLVF